MLDQNVALNVITALNVGYATNMLVAPWFWLEQSEMNAEGMISYKQTHPHTPTHIIIQYT